jgi:hypothetical protein
MPPLRVIPNPTKDLQVAQRGNQVVFRFGYPQTTTSGAKLPGLAAVEVWELTRPLSPAVTTLPILEPQEFVPAAKLLATLRGAELTSAIEGGQVVIRLPLPTPPPAPSPAPRPAPSPSPSPSPSPATTATAPPAAERTLHVYAVRTVAQEGETSAWSNLANLVPQAPPPPPTGLGVEPRAKGVELGWQSPPDGIAGFAVYRRPAEGRTYGEPLATLPKEARTYLDESAKYGQRYIYTVTALGSTEPRVESAAGEEREVDYEDRFAPAPPDDLVALPSEAGVNLVWQPSPDADTVGYLVYRQDPGAAFRKLTAKPITDLKYADTGLTTGLRFRYHVTAVDGAGNEGPPTPDAEALAH